MTAICPCGAELPDARAKFCPGCRGARTKAQDVARSERKAIKFKERIWWLYFRNALRYVIWLRYEAGAGYGAASIPYDPAKVAGEWGLADKSLKRAARGAGVQLDSLKAALDEQPVSRQVFLRLCKWMGWPPCVFERARMSDPRSYASAQSDLPLPAEVRFGKARAQA